MPVRNRIISLLLAPIVVFLWCIGWSLYWIGLKRNRAVAKPKLSRENDLTFIVPVPEQKDAIYKPHSRRLCGQQIISYRRCFTHFGKAHFLQKNGFVSKFCFTPTVKPGKKLREASSFSPRFKSPSSLHPIAFRDTLFHKP